MEGELRTGQRPACAFWHRHCDKVMPSLEYRSSTPEEATQKTNRMFCCRNVEAEKVTALVEP